MKLLKCAAALSLAATATLADEAQSFSVTNCGLRLTNSDIVVCDVTNLSGTAIAAIEVNRLMTEEGRTVPWHDDRGDRIFPRYISGGIEPSEIAKIPFQFGFIPSRADKEKLKFEIIPVRALDIDGNPIE
jgi:hypothetical protein